MKQEGEAKTEAVFSCDLSIFQTGVTAPSTGLPWEGNRVALRRARKDGNTCSLHACSCLGLRPHLKTNCLTQRCLSPVKEALPELEDASPPPSQPKNAKNKVKTQLRFWLLSGPAPGWELSPNFP